MAKRRKAWNEKIYHRYLREGRGSGDLKDYNPWLHTNDVPSLGKVARVKGLRTGRIHHLLSGLELAYFLYLDSLPGIEDIKEQFPLPLRDTQLIAASLKIKHPEVNGFPYVMTTDFYYCCDGQWHAVQIKPTSVLEDKRVLEKLKIERQYWESQNVDFRIVTEKALNPHLVHNLEWIRAGDSLENLIPNPVFREEIKELFLDLYNDFTFNFQDILYEIDTQCEFPKGTALQIFKSLVLSHDIILDLRQEINQCDPRIMASFNIYI